MRLRLPHIRGCQERVYFLEHCIDMVLLQGVEGGLRL